jgi:uncharacterized membrane protein YgcG
VRHPVVGTVGYPAATRLSNKGSLVKVLSRLASPAGFALVLMLFFLLPFLSVSCDVPGYQDLDTRYTGSHLVSGVDPEVPTELRKLADEADAPAQLVDPPDAKVQVLAIVLAVFAAGGVLTGLLPRLRLRMLGAAATAGATLVMTVVTMAVAQSNIQSTLFDWMRETSVAEDKPEQLEAGIDDLTHTEVGFWLMVVLLALIMLVTATLGLFGDRLRLAKSERASGGGGGFGSLSFGKGNDGGRKRPPPD